MHAEENNATYTSSDNTQKVLLIHKTEVGVSFCGNSIIDGVTVADYIQRFEEDPTEIVANKLAEYYGKTETHFFVCGYNYDTSYVFDVYGKTVKRSNITELLSNNFYTKYAADDGNAELPDVGVPENIKEEAMQDLSDNSEPIIQYGAIGDGQKTAITKIVNNAPILNVDWKTMPLTDAIDFAEFLIDTTIKYERFCDEIQTCGGISTS